MPGRLEPPPVPRRDFLNLAGLWTAGLAVFGSLLGMIRLARPRVLPEPTSRVRIGRADEYPAGTIRILPQRSLRVVSQPEGIAVQSLVCTHLGCIVKEAASGLECPCHGSKFDQEGKVEAGPAPRALRWLAVSRAADGTLMVDALREVEPGTFFEV